MADNEIWLSEDEEETDHELELSTDPRRFNLSLTYQGGQPGGYHVRNQNGEFQRAAVSAFHGGSRKKPAFTVSCDAKAIIHGRMGPTSAKQATLLVYEFKFLSWRAGTRIKEADILFEFQALSTGPGALGPSVVEVRPKGQSRMGETIQNQAIKFGLTFNIGPAIPGVEAGVTASSEQTKTKDVKYHTKVTGDNPAEIVFGGRYQAKFRLEENENQASGIPTQLTVVMLLEHSGEDFQMIPRIQATPDLRTMVASLASSRAPDDPVYFSTQAPPVIHLDGNTQIDVDNLGATDLDSLWICNMYDLYMSEIHKVELNE